jgi:hypothetical protein
VVRNVLTAVLGWLAIWNCRVLTPLSINRNRYLFLLCFAKEGSQTNGAEGAGTNQGRPLFKINAAAPALVVAVVAAAGPSKPNFMQAMLQNHG